MNKENNNPKKKNSLDDMLMANQSVSDKEKLEQKAKKKKRITYSVIGVVVVALILLLNPWTSPFFNKSETPVVPKYTATEDEVAPETQAWYESDPDAIWPFKMAEWQKGIAVTDSQGLSKEQKDYFQKTQGKTALAATAKSSLLSESGGVTTDPSKALDKNGLPNLNYTYLSSELFLIESGNTLEMMINPVYGGWAQYQFADADAAKNFSVDQFGSVFTSKFMKKLAKEPKTSYPFLADWRGNSLGLGDKAIPGAPAYHIGRVKAATSVFKYDEKKLNYNIDATYTVEFLVKTVDKKIEKKTGTLKVRWVTNTDVVNNPHQFRVLVDNATLTMK